MSSFIRKSTLTNVLNPGQQWTLKNQQGFTVFYVNEAGDIARKGKDVKLS